MQKFKSAIAIVLLMTFLLLTCLSGCGNGKATLTVLIDGTLREDMRRQIRNHIREYEDTHSGIVFELKVLSTDKAEREAMLERLRTQIMAGKGPDIYLLPTSNSFYLGALFQDVNQTMRNGVFADISEYYDADTALDKDGLVTEVMDAGLVGEARYTLPLRYDFPVAYVDTAQFAAAGLSMDIFDGGLTKVLEAVTTTNNSKVATSADMDMVISQCFLNFFPEIVDYEEQEVLLTQESVAEFLYLLQSQIALAGDKPLYRMHPTLSGYISESESFWANQGFCMNIDNLEMAVLNGAIAKVQGIDLEMFPLTANDGSLIADVTFFGAIGGGCKKTDVAYDFLRQFLLAQTQWEENRPQRADTSRLGDERLIEAGWPVRAAGATAKLYDSVWDQVNGVRFANKEATENLPQFKQLQLLDEDISVAQADISSVRYPIISEYEIGRTLWDVLSDPDVNIDALAAQIEETLQWHLAEG